ncbi:MAG: hypothetical protein QNI86_09915 [Halieaceae bacterium]|nr:hypothetical protein [Halieaceae bacterium]
MTLAEQLRSLAEAETLPASYPAMAERWFAPLAEWLALRHRALDAPLLVGVNGAQGTGKTTACAVFSLMLREHGVRPLTLSLDDFYLDRAARRQLADDVHPLLITRGVPGTHEVSLLEQTLDAVLAGQSARVPVFDKAIDDRLPESEWLDVGAADVILLEGWCIGATPEPVAALKDPLNDLEARDDPDGLWRRFVNDELAGPYAVLFDRLHELVMLKAPSLARVLEWRRLQEEKLAQRRSGGGVMSPAEIKHFVEHYERVTRHCLEEMPARADYLLEVADDHSICGASYRKSLA